MEENVIHINAGIMINVNVCVEKDYIWNPATCTCENGEYLASIIDDSAIKCDYITESYNGEIKTILTNFNAEKSTCKMQNFCILVTFLLITITLLIAVSIYCYLIKSQAKQKSLRPFHDTNNKLREIFILINVL